MNDYATHLPLLVTVVSRTEGPVLELGCGDYSTPILHSLCKDRLLISADEKKEWVEKFKKWGTGLHRIELVNDWQKFLASLKDIQFGIIFVDHAPGERRKDDINFLRGQAKYIVVHDTEEAGYKYEPVLNSFRYRYDYDLLRPHTTVVSDVAETNIFFMPR
jgi:hypothetical protein